MNTEKTINQIVEYNPLIAAREELLKKYQGVVYDVTIPEQYDNAELERKAFVKLSNQIEKVRKEISAPLHAAYKAVIAKGNELAAPLDERIAELAALIKAQDAKQTAINTELKKQIADIRATPMTMVGRSSDDMQEAHAALFALNAKDFDVYQEVAQNAINEALAQLEPMIAATVNNEALARKQAEQQAILDARQAELDKAEREQQEKAAEAKRLADLETARLQGIEQAKKEVQIEADNAERARQQQEAADIEAKQKAEALRPDQDKLKAWLQSCVDSAPVLIDEKLQATVNAIVQNFKQKIEQLS